MAIPPQALRAVLSEQAFEIQWPQEEPVKVPFRDLRGLCPCANCVNELSGERTFFADQAEADVRPKKLEQVGNYAVKISWSDGHRTGLYTWDYLHQICDSLRN